MTEHAAKPGHGRRGNPHRWWWVVALLVAAVLVFVVLRKGGVPGKADPDDPVQVALGEKVYAANCAQCHGVNLEGQPDWRTRKADGKLPAPPQDASGHSWHHPDSFLFEVTKNGTAAFAPPGYQSDMAAFGDRLSDAEIWAVIAFIKSRWPPEIRHRQSQMRAHMN